MDQVCKNVSRFGRVVLRRFSRAISPLRSVVASTRKRPGGIEPPGLNGNALRAKSDAAPTALGGRLGAGWRLSNGSGTFRLVRDCKLSRAAIPPSPVPPVAVLVETLAGLIAVRVFAFRL